MYYIRIIYIFFIVSSLKSAVIVGTVLDENNKVIHSELVAEITEEPNYDAALNVLR